MQRRIIGIMSLVLITMPSFSQDDHYWTQQYGAANSAMGGAVVAGVRDNTAIFYNPGAIGFVTNSSLSVDANVIRLDKIFIDDGLGNGVNLKSNQVSVYPQVLSGLVGLGKHNRWKLTFALLTRQWGNILMNTRYADTDIPAGSAPNQHFIGALSYSSQLNEQWLGLGAGYRANDHLSFGGTLFISYRAQSYQMTNDISLVSLVDSANLFGLYKDEKSVKYHTFSGLLKIGMAWQAGKWKLGLTLTTPSIQFSGNGRQDLASIGNNHIL